MSPKFNFCHLLLFISRCIFINYIIFILYLGEFNHFADEEEFVNFNNDEDHEDEFEHMSTKGRGAKEKPRARPTAAPPKTIKITNIPAHLRNNVGKFL